MKWIALAIFLVIGPYTFLRWHYRKPQPAFEPYHDLRDRANTSRLLSAGFQRVTIVPERPADPMRNSAAVATSPAPAGLPSDLTSTLVEPPTLLSDIFSVTAPGEANTLFAYALEFTCGVPENQQQLGNVYLYLREDKIYIVPEMERLSGALLSRNRENLIRVIVPAGVLKPGKYDVTLIAARSSQSWSLEVK
jgi:hypothetical protein